MKRIYTYMCLLLLSVCSFAVAGCDDDDDNGVAKDLIEVIVNKPVVRIGQNEEVKVNIVVGNGDYTVRSFNSAIATAGFWRTDYNKKWFAERSNYCGGDGW